MAFLEIKEKRDLRENKWGMKNVGGHRCANDAICASCRDLEGQSLRREAVDQLVILESLYVFFGLPFNAHLYM